MKTTILILTLAFLIVGCAPAYVFFTLAPGTAWGVPCLGDLKPQKVGP